MVVLLPKSNAAAAVLSLAAFVVLTIAILSPFITLMQLGDEQSFSMVGGILELFRRGDIFIAVVLMTFSIAFPYVKLAAIIAAVARQTGLCARTRIRLQHFAITTGKFSMLDVFVVAVLIVVLNLQGFADASAEYGVVLFTIAVGLSMAASLTTIADGSAQMNEPAAPTQQRFPSSKWALAGLVFLLAGSSLVAFGWYSGRTAPISGVRVSFKPGMNIPKIADLIRNPDLYVLAILSSGENRSSEKRPNAVVGNGLRFGFHLTVPFNRLQSVELWDSRDTFADALIKLRQPRLLDHVDNLKLVTDGERFRFEMESPAGLSLRTRLCLHFGLGVLLLGAVCLLPWLIRIARRHTV